jgi:SNF2 family DNA or RNA helicase
MNLKTEPLPYQSEAFEKLKDLKVGALFMDMGTGKTRTVFELCNFKLEYGKASKLLYLCPYSIKQNVREQFDQHWHFDNACMRIVGIESISGSDRIYSECLEWVNGKTIVIVDESTLIKNVNAKRTRRITEIGKMAKYRYILTGNPTPRNMADIFSQLYFLSPLILGYNSYYSFAANHLEFDQDNPHIFRRAHNVDQIAKKMQPYVYQVKKSECLELPLQHESYRRCFSTSEESDKYEAVKEEFFEKIIKGDDLSRVGDIIFSLFTQLAHVSGMCQNRFLSLQGVVEEINLQDNKLVIFFKYLSCMEQAKKALEYYQIYSIDGNQSEKKRNANLFGFKKDGQILLITYQVGAYGLNLQMANYAIYFEGTFDYGLVEQSENRIHRMGQSKDCYYIHILNDFKIDSMMDKCISNKVNVIQEMTEAIKKVKNDKTKDVRKELKSMFEGI